ncbi:hypothetical protein [Hyalangium rubrum]|uniref:Ig-like domain-containing protein n=1 Tax=Hyalangium rubrum TaxID=3103134 RepID=A0ABU5HHS3_9BACT|nr:hypothetical protein [Hyalangium sp. s54d21]MDY7233000.1 hypothetical protein [Hyalangium sp. s54d21]
MSRKSHRFAPRALLACGLLLSACGAPPEDTTGEEPVGTSEAPICAALSVSSLAITDANSYGGDLAALGTWAVSLYANAVRVEYYVDGVLKNYDPQRPGNSGSWYHSSSGLSCGTHTLEVRAYPMVIDSNGNQTVCSSSPRSVTQTVTQPCPTASLSCSKSGTNVSCTGSASGGYAPYTLFWKKTVDLSSGTWNQGASTNSFYCATASGRDSFVRKGIQFKVRDSQGMESPTVSDSYICAP